MNWQKLSKWTVLLAGLLAMILPLFIQADEVEQQTITIKPEVQYQTIRGWGATTTSIEIPEMLRNAMLDELVNDLGLTRLRLEPPGGNSSSHRRWEWHNDNGDPQNINWSAFNTETLDKKVSFWMKPFKERVEANGDPFNLYISPSFFDGGSTGSAPAWLFESPAEYAEFAISLILYLKNKHGIVADYYSILNEAGNNNSFTPEVVAGMVKALGPRLKSLNLPTTIEFPECMNANESWHYIQAVQADAELWKYVGLISYHLYGGNTDRPKIYEFAKAKGLPTAQTENMSTKIDDFYSDLRTGGVSYWEHYVLAYYGNRGGSGHYLSANYNMTSFSRYREYWSFRQIMHYIRPGAVRVEVVKDNGFVRPLAFVQEGEVTVVLVNRYTPFIRDYVVAVKNLPPGKYGVCRTIAHSRFLEGPYEELGIQTVGEGKMLAVEVPRNSVLTIYPYPGENQPPTVTDWRATPNYLTVPQEEITLSASATDPELDAISFLWSVEEKPEAANVMLISPDASQTEVKGLTAPGDYIFAVAVSDGTHRVVRKVVITVFSGNQPPISLDVHNRIPVVVTLPQSTTILRGAAFDLEGDPLQYRWSVLAQPQGAQVKLETPDQPGCKVSNIKVPGEYIFQLAVKDPTHTVQKNLKITVYPPNEAPVIETASATPERLALPQTQTSLSAKTSDPDGDTITHWWSVKKSPVGSKPVFDRQGARETSVSGLSVPGTYTFTLKAIDRTKSATKDVTVTVAAKGEG
jgi:O-glycosyl hydrolase